MPEFDLVIRNGTVATAADTMECDVGIKDGVVVALGRGLGLGAREIDASGKLVLPGGIDSHCHIEQRSSAGVVCADDFYSATVAAAFGGTTTVIPFAAQHRGQSLRQVVQDYHAAARPKAIIDYAFHLIITDPTADIMGQELPALIQDGYTSFKVYMTYDLLQLDDGQMLDILAVARREGALVMVHAENYDMIKWLTGRLLERGLAEPRWHAVSHARLAEGEATNRAVTLSQLVDVPILLVHVSAAEAIEVIRNAQTRGLKIYGETCPQYLFLTADDIAKPGLEGAKFCCSPPPRDAAAQQAVWQGLQKRHLPGVFLGSRALSLRPVRQAAAWRQDHLQGHRQRRPRHRTAPAAAVFRGCRPRPARPQPVRRLDRDQPRQALRALSRKRARSPSAATPTSRSGTPRARSRSPPACCTTMSATPPMKAATCTAGR